MLINIMLIEKKNIYFDIDGLLCKYVCPKGWILLVSYSIQFQLVVQFNFNLLSNSISICYPKQFQHKQQQTKQ